MSDIQQSSEFYTALRELIPNLPEHEVISAVIRINVHKLPTIEVTQYLKTADGDLAIEDKEILAQTRKFKIVPLDDE